MNWYLTVWRKSLDLNGRASRTEYWMFVLVNFIFVLCAAGLDNLLGIHVGFLPYGFIYFLYLLAIVVPSFSVTIRRLHDVGRSGWMLLLLIIPFVGAICIFVFTLLDGNPGNNKYGRDPKEDEISYNKTF